MTAQYLGYVQGHIFQTPLTPEMLNASIAATHKQFVFTNSCATAKGLAGKLSSGIGGVNACVLYRPFPAKEALPVAKPNS